MNLQYLVNRLLLEAVSLDKVYAGAEKYLYTQPAKKDRAETGDIMFNWGNVKEYWVTPIYGTKTLDSGGEVKSEKEPHRYKVRIQFYGVKFSDKFTPETPVKWVDTKKQVFYSSLLSPKTQIAVNCTCPDFRFTWGWYLKKEGGLIGTIKSYTRKTTYWKPRNVGKVIGACKHIFSVLAGLEQYGVISLKRISKNEINMVDKVSK